MLQGLNILIPVVDRIKYVQSLKEKAIDIPSQSAITEGNLEHLISQTPPFVTYNWGQKAHIQVGGKIINFRHFFITQTM